MTLEETLSKAGDALRRHAAMPEAGVQMSVIRPILRALGWDDADPGQWQVEFSVGGGRVDEALLGTTGRPLVFIEAKRPGGLSTKAENQLIGYANNKGVPILVLTDGDTWDLYLSMAPGELPERRFCHFVLTDASTHATTASDLRVFLERGAVLSDEARKAAEVRLQQVKDRRKGLGGLHSTWKRLLQDADEFLRDLLIEQVEEAVGARPSTSDTEAFLKQQAESIVQPKTRQRAVGPSHQEPKKKPTLRLVGYEHKGARREYKNGRKTFVGFASALQDQDSNFLARWAESKASGNIKHPRAVQDGDPILASDVSHYYAQVSEHPAWWLNVNWSAKSMIRLMEEMAGLAGLDWERDVKLVVEEG